MLQLQALIVLLILISYILTAHVIQIKKIPFLHESVVAIFMGIIFAAIMKYTLNDEVIFDSEFFFNFLLPPIIFAAGYNLHRAHFFDNFWLITYHGIICTIFTFIILTVFVLLFNEWNLTDIKFGEDEIMLLTATLCATDTVAALTLVKESEYPILNSVLFGEGIFNDAVSILIFRSVKNYMSENSSFSQISWGISLTIFVDFVYLLIVSLAVGIFIGAISALLFKYCDSLLNHPLKETSLILLLGYGSYLIAEQFHLSGILSLFCCGVIMAVYTYPNISSTAQQGTSLAFDTIGYLVEGFVFAYLGITTLENPASSIPWLFSFLMILAIAFARFLTVFMMPCFYFIFKKPFSLSVKELQIVWYSGMIRGVIAFALSATITTKNQSALKGSVLFIVLVTTCIGSMFLETFAKFIGLKVDESSLINFQEFINKSKSQDISCYHTIGDGPKQGTPVKEQVQTDGNVWQRLEQKIVRPIFQKKPNQVEDQEISMYQLQSL